MSMPLVTFLFFIMAVALAGFLAPLDFLQEPQTEGGEQQPNDDVIKWTEPGDESNHLS